MTRSRNELTPNYTLQRTAGSLMLALRPLSATLGFGTSRESGLG